MNTHQKFMKCQEELLLKHIRFFKGEQPGVGYLDIASVVSPHMVNMTAYDGMKSLFDKHSYDTIVAVEGDAWLYAPASGAGVWQGNCLGPSAEWFTLSGDLRGLSVPAGNAYAGA